MPRSKSKKPLDEASDSRPCQENSCLYAALITVSLITVCFPAGALELPPGFVADTLATNLNAAAALAVAPDGRIFIAEQTGPLRVWKDGRLLPTPALDLTARVDSFWERGLVGVTLALDFPHSPHLFVLYVARSPFTHHVLSRFTLNGDVADPASEKVLLEGDDQNLLGGSQPGGHQGGPLRFGSDGKLYVSIGEQTAGEPAQKLATLQGKILRLNPDGSIPDDNPFLAQTTGKYRAIYALGLRNCFGLAVQSRADGGRMFFTDVGGSAFEEVNELKPGANYGWPRAEGFSTNSAFVQPLHAYPPLIGQSIVGGVFLPKTGASAWPAKWRGRFLFADFMRHWIKALDPEAPTNVLTFAKGFNGPVATELAADGSLLVLNRGAIWRDPKKFVPNAGSLVRIRYIGDSVLAGAEPPSHPARPTFTPALGLPATPAALPKQIARADWEARFRGVKRWPFWLNGRAWLPFMHESIGLYLPAGSVAKLSDDAYEIQLPPGAVVVRNFGVSAWQPRPTKDSTSRLLETRLLVVGAPRGYGAAYRWKSPELAELIEDGELEIISDLAGETSTEGLRQKVSLPWWFPGVDDGISFPITNPSYWVSTAVQDFIFPPGRRDPQRPINWLRSMQRAGVLETTLSPEALDRLPRGAMWHSPLEPAEARVRSYLHGNCAVCHQPGGASRGTFDA
ncbi:MAG: PQQ-dependent sugar dehydrogenase, partial [Verrucomicrobia subdivision 3 bacterium]|nr:PQQ-dependent sugar dehydrogenase [Limisphaerales bacterium]